MDSGEVVAGPTVATILVRRIRSPQSFAKKRFFRIPTPEILIQRKFHRDPGGNSQASLAMPETFAVRAQFGKRESIGLQGITARGKWAANSRTYRASSMPSPILACTPAKEENGHDFHDHRGCLEKS